MKIYRLHQWHQVTAIGEEAIIKRANEVRESMNIPLRDEYRDNVVITTIQEATEYFCMTEQGHVSFREDKDENV